MSTDNRPSSYPLRIDNEMRTKLETLAKANGRSLNTEIAMRLEASLMNDSIGNEESELEKTIRHIVREELAKHINT